MSACVLFEALSISLQDDEGLYKAKHMGHQKQSTPLQFPETRKDKKGLHFKTPFSREDPWPEMICPDPIWGTGKNSSSTDQKRWESGGEVY